MKLRHVPADGRLRPIVLVVEDDRDQRQVLCAILELEGFDHSEAANGREALDYLREFRAPCLVLLDLDMPLMNGWEFRANQLADDRISRIPVVVITANDKQLISGLPGVEDFLRKPLIVGKLIAVLDRVCFRNETEPPAITVVED